MPPVVMASLDDYVEAFEQARRSAPEVDLESFLPPPDDPLYRSVLRELIRIDLEFGWESNRPRSLEDYRTSFPALFSDPESLQEVAFEDYRLRQQAGQAPSPEEYARRYGVRTDGWPVVSGAPQTSIRVQQAAYSFRAFLAEGGPMRGAGSWQPPANVGDEVAGFFRHLHSIDHLAAARLADGVTHFPLAGDDFLGFHLLTELGRGAFGRVYLARQALLADRLVALKVSPDVGGESQTLAQMQHTHVVPVYSVHRSGALQAVCMPFTGSLTLGDLIREMQKSLTFPSSGADLASLIRQRPRRDGVPRQEVEPIPEISKRGYGEAVLWMGGRLADGLAHAHQRGILHRDVKPANVLLTDDGVPMLLDFNVAEDVKQRGPGGAVLGGTLPYMAPEQLEAFVSGNPVTLDGRCDVYSLGIVLYELLTGRFPFPAHPAASDLPASLAQMLADRLGPAPCPREYNQAISPAAAAIVLHCLEPDPRHRYPTAAALREDVERHLRDEPLKYAPDRSPSERLRKLIRRNPRLPLVLTVAALVLLTALGAGLGYRYRENQRADEARVERLHFHRDHQLAQFYLGTGREDPHSRRAGVEAARKALGRYHVLDDRQWRSRVLFTSLPPEAQAATRAEVAELLLLLARACGQEDGAEEGLKLNRLAEECFGDEVPGALHVQRVWLRCQAGLPDESAIEIGLPLSARDRFLEAQELFANNEFSQAARLLELALRQQPDHYWARFLLGLCHEWLGNDPEAEKCYDVCVALMPDFHATYLNRGLVLLRQKKYPRAVEDLDRVVEAVPDRPQTYFDRALARHGAGDREGAIADLDEAQRLGLSPTRICLLRATWRDRTDRAAAQRDREEGLRHEPRDASDYLARGTAWRKLKEYDKALADFDAALELNPQVRAGWMNRANVLAEYLGRQEEASAALDRLLELYPQHAPALAGQAVVLARLGDRERAHSRIAEALARDGSGEVRYQAGCVYALTAKKMPADAATALWYLHQAIDLRFGLEFIDRDDDLKVIRRHPNFVKLVDAVKVLHEAKR